LVGLLFRSSEPQAANGFPGGWGAAKDRGPKGVSFRSWGGGGHRKVGTKAWHCFKGC